jgi:hypothetical protein
MLDENVVTFGVKLEIGLYVMQLIGDFAHFIT